MANLVTLPYQYFPDPTKGRPVFLGDIFIGESDLDPEIEANRKTVTLRQQDGTEVPILPSAQPLETGAGGVVLYNGSAVQVLTDGNYSIKVLNNQGTQVYYVENVFDGEPVTSEEIIVPEDTVFDAIANQSIVLGQKVITSGYTTINDGGNASYIVVAAGTGIDDGGSYHNMDNGLQLELIIDSPIDVKVFGAFGDGTTDDTAIFANTKAVSDTLVLTNTSYLLTSLVSLSNVESDFSTIIFNGTETNEISIDCIGTMDIIAQSVSTTTASNVTVSGSSLVVTVVSTAIFTINDVILVSESTDISFQGAYTVANIGAGNITLSGANSENVTQALTANITKFNSISNGITIKSGIINISDIGIQCTGKYGILSGGDFSSEPIREQSLVNISRLVVANASSSGIISSSSVVGVNNVATLNCNRGILAFRNATLIGTNVYARDSTDDAFKCEHSSNMFIDGFLADDTSSQSGLGSRYSSSQEMSNGLIVDCQLAGALVQFDSYLSIREVDVRTTENYGAFATDSGTLVTNNVTTEGSTVNSIRIIQDGTLIGLNTLDISADSDALFIGGPVEFNGIKYSGERISGDSTPGNIIANSRFTEAIAATGVTLVYTPSVTLTLYTDLPSGIVVNHTIITDNEVTIIFTNTTDSNINVGQIDFQIGW